MAMPPKKPTNESKTKPFNSRLMTPKELAGKDKPKVMPKKATSGIRPTAKAVEKAKTAAKATAKAKSAMPKSKGPAVLVGEAAAEAMRKRTSPKGVKEFEKGASKALDKKYPGLYKKSK